MNHEGNTLNALANAPLELFSSPSTELASRKQAFVEDAFGIRGGFKGAYRWKRKRVGAVWIVGGAPNRGLIDQKPSFCHSYWHYGHMVGYGGSLACRANLSDTVVSGFPL